MPAQAGDQASDARSCLGQCGVERLGILDQGRQAGAGAVARPGRPLLFAGAADSWPLLWIGALMDLLGDWLSGVMRFVMTHSGFDSMRVTSSAGSMAASTPSGCQA